MKTYVFEGVVTALSSIAHNGGEKNGITSQLRREKIVQPDGRAVEVPMLSGNMMRGILRDSGMLHMCRALGYGVDEETGEVRGLPLPAFYFLFSGGSLTGSGGGGVDIEGAEALKRLIPLVAVFGGAREGGILNGKLKVGKLIPICRETAHLIPPRHLPEALESVWEYSQLEMNTRRDDTRTDRLLPLLERVKETGKPEKIALPTPQQMMYNTETLAAGTRFFWDIVLEDPTGVEFESFVACLLEFARRPYIGGRSAVGHGKVSVKMDNWMEIDSRASLEGRAVGMPLMERYSRHLSERRAEITECLNAMT